jgi:hypothetical protein
MTATPDALAAAADALHLAADALAEAAAATRRDRHEVAAVPPGMCSIEAARTALGLSRSGLLAAVERGEVMAVKVGRRRLVPTVELERLSDPRSQLNPDDRALRGHRVGRNRMTAPAIAHARGGPEADDGGPAEA